MRAKDAMLYIIGELGAIKNKDMQQVSQIYISFIENYNDLYPEFKGVAPELTMNPENGTVEEITLTVNGVRNNTEKAQSMYLSAPKDGVKVVLFRQPIDMNYDTFALENLGPDFKWDSVLVSFLPSAKNNHLDIYLYMKNKKVKDLIENQISQLLDNSIGEFKAMSTLNGYQFKVERRKPTDILRPLNEIKTCFDAAYEKMGETFNA